MVCLFTSRLTLVPDCTAWYRSHGCKQLTPSCYAATIGLGTNSRPLDCMSYALPLRHHDTHLSISLSNLAFSATFVFFYIGYKLHLCLQRSQGRFENIWQNCLDCFMFHLSFVLSSRTASKRHIGVVIRSKTFANISHLLFVDFFFAKLCGHCCIAIFYMYFCQTFVIVIVCVWYAKIKGDLLFLLIHSMSVVIFVYVF